ncbi:MAG: queuosine precursor transporter [Gammaproteobacteria bacterium]|nr:queuosine precursor transporter [Gammaproteobacteria bacterium]
MSDLNPNSAAKRATAGDPLHRVDMPWQELVYMVLAMTFVTLLVLTNVIGQKLFYLWGQTLTAGLITYPLTFLVTDIVSEIFGKKRADRMVWAGFAMSLLMLVIVQISIHLPVSPYWSSALVPEFSDGDRMQQAWLASFGVGWWLVSGSMCAYLVAQLLDNRLFHFWRRLTGGRHLWLRNNGSTLVSQLVDTFIVNSFLFYGAFGWEFWQGVKVMFVIYLFKLGIALLDTPFCYLGIYGVRRLLRRKGVAA